ncbi:hypothetical protein MLD52_06525 [Puniceicoccaceae bacterium K14]|nr:hypothetical protein [Puniceicoccaceae bacterium K14]
MINPIPKNLDFIEEHGKLVIRRKWFGPQFIFLTVFCVLWDGFLVFWYSVALSTPDAPLMMKLFPIGHIAVGLGLTYYVIAGYLNKTDISLDPSFLEVKHYPVKWFGNKRIDIGDIKQVYTEEIVTRTKNGTRISYVVKVIQSNDKAQKLVSGLSSKDQGIFIESKIENILGIKNVPVSGEV